MQYVVFRVALSTFNKHAYNLQGYKHYSTLLQLQIRYLRDVMDSSKCVQKYMFINVAEQCVTKPYLYSIMFCKVGFVFLQEKLSNSFERDVSQVLSIIVTLSTRLT